MLHKHFVIFHLELTCFTCFATFRLELTSGLGIFVILLLTYTLYYFYTVTKQEPYITSGIPIKNLWKDTNHEEVFHEKIQREGGGK